MDPLNGSNAQLLLRYIKAEAGHDGSRQNKAVDHRSRSSHYLSAPAYQLGWLSASR